MIGPLRSDDDPPIEQRLPDWRVGTARQLMADGALVQVIFALVTPFLLSDPWYRPVVIGSMTVAATVLVVGRAAPLPHAARAWCLVSNFIGLAFGSFVLFGPASGALLLGGAGLVMARALLGPVATAAVAAALTAGLAAIASAHLMRTMPWEVPSPTVSLLAAEPWIRTAVSGSLVVTLLVRLVGVMIREVESANARNVELLREAERAVRLRDRFLDLASHELRTPLTALLWAAEGVETRRFTLTQSRFERLAGLITRNVERLRVLVVQLVDATAIEAGRLALNPTGHDLVALVRRVVQRFDAQPLRTAVIDLFLPNEVFGMWDAARLELVVHNLVQNALRFGEGGPVSVFLKEAEGQVVLSVRDHGRGIGAQQLPHLFERFHPSAEAAPSSGLGLGLYMVRAIVEAHGGVVWVDTQVGRGSTFHVALPWTGREPASGGA